MKLPHYTASQCGGPGLYLRQCGSSVHVHNTLFPTSTLQAAVADGIFQRQHNLPSSVLFLQDDVDTPSIDTPPLLFETEWAPVTGSTNKIQHK